MKPMPDKAAAGRGLAYLRNASRDARHSPGFNTNHITPFAAAPPSRSSRVSSARPTRLYAIVHAHNTRSHVLLLLTDFQCRASTRILPLAASTRSRRTPPSTATSTASTATRPSGAMTYAHTLSPRPAPPHSLHAQAESFRPERMLDGKFEALPVRTP